ncbi:uncharacterized protein EDB91DRAFT_1050846, partial [Suillus paluster]|uniref:uncharacterized protein n=1 Tax=Suillus paluster TaxID=48578 RepID=UPI001B874381
LCNGGIIPELDSKESVLRLRHKTTWTAFLKVLDFSVTFKDRTYTLIAQYVPVNILIEQPGIFCLVENKNRLKNNSLASMRWIKPPHKQSPTQMMVFALL